MYFVLIRRYARVGLLEQRELGPYRFKALARMCARLHTFENRHVCQVAETVARPPSRPAGASKRR